MYHLRPVAGVPEKIDLPTCMYHIKPMNGIQTTSLPNGLAPVKRVKMDPQFEAIEERQLQVIARLRQLRDTVNDMIVKSGAKEGQGKVSKQAPVNTASKASTCLSSARPSTCVSSVLLDATLPSEVVIEANPSRPPLSLVFFMSLNPQLRTLTHVHSSYSKNVDGKLNSLFTRDTSGSTIRVIWKDVNGTRLTPLALGSLGAEGEANVARFLSRVLAKPDSVLNYDALTPEDLVLVDGVLESSELVDTAPDHFLNSLQAYLQRRGSSGGVSNRTIADYVGYSTLRYLTKQKSQQSLQKSLIDWMNSLTNEVPALC
ncbi:Aminoacyl tRNA synthase complex-interacting multifunctional protein 2 [Orchesella cincta]|uniref:Aminoacyl tRNA synthase complex-interacting multifunctional protein 2 n=1 Tax=Orchesella cincta TaxID=48709 RepID=A0A1D2NG79_ORCCI|nr:Aminoacyl tRNA synthase complex-interacting multifunctional protein 2 [Orchesella cincta]